MTPSHSNPRFTIENNVLKGAEISYPDDITNVGKFVLESLEKNLDFVGLIDAVTGEEYTYRKMRERSVRCAVWMRSQGILPRDVISVCSDNRLDYMTPCFAALYLGAVYSCWNVALDAEGLCHRMNVTKSKIVFANENSVSAVAEAVRRAELDVKIIVFGNATGFSDLDSIIGEPGTDVVESFVCAPVESLAEIASILFSSGTTGPPKGVAHSHGTLKHAMYQAEAIGIAGQVCLNFANPDWCSMPESAFMHIFLNVSRIITPAFKDPASTCALIEKHKATWILLTPTMINRILKSGVAKEFDLSSVTRVFYGGSSLSIPSYNALANLLPNAVITSGYGMTESGGWSTLQTGQYKLGSCGQMMANAQLKVVDLNTGRTLEANQRGEICLKDPFVMNCYYNNPQATAQAFDNEGWLISGDLGYYDEDGEVFVIDRMKDVIRCTGYDICPSEIETVIMTHPGVKEVAVVGKSRDDADDLAMAFVVRTENTSKNGEQVTEKDIVDLVAAELPDSRRLRAGVKFIDEIPKSGTSKIRRLALRELARLDGRSTTTITAFREALIRVTPQCLKVPLAGSPSGIVCIFSRGIYRYLVMAPSHNNRRFTIENNVLKGVEIACPNDITHVGKFVLDSLEKDLDFVGLIDAVTEEEYTYRKMRDRSVRCALWMRSQGILPRDVISVCSYNRLDYMMPCFAALYLGAVYSCWTVTVDAEGLRHRINVTKSKIVFADENSVAAVAEAVRIGELDVKIIVFGKVTGFMDFDSIIGEPGIDEVKSFVYAPIESLEEIAAILFSSGTTGPAKGVALSHGTIKHQISHSETLEIAGSVCLNFFNADWCLTLDTAFMHIFLKVSRIITPVFQDPASACALIEKHKATWILLTPTSINSLLKSGVAKEYDLSSLTRVFHGGTSLSIPSYNAFAKLLPNARIFCSYGMTESGIRLSLQTVTSKSGSCGQILPNSQLKIVDLNTKETLGVNQRGELLMKTPYMMRCYYNNPEATAEAFDDEGWLISGDVAYYDEDGEIFVIDRLKDIIRLVDDDVCPSEIETVIMSHPGVKEVAVVGQPRDDGDDLVMAFVVRAEDSSKIGEQVTENEIVDLVAAELPDSRRLRAGVKFIDKIPKTASNKIARVPLRELARSMA